MLKKVSEVAQRAATNVSRRRFLGRFGKGAMAVAAAAAGLLVGAGDARGARKARRVVCCFYDGGGPDCQYNKCSRSFRYREDGRWVVDRLIREIPCDSLDHCYYGSCCQG